MWIEIKVGLRRHIVNTNMIETINRYVTSDNVEIFFSSKSQLNIAASCDSEKEAIFDGMNLALNGLDFVWGDNYIKPLKQSADESLYKYIKLKEILGDRK